MIIERNKVITLGNGERYFVVSSVVHNNNHYYYIAECGEQLGEIKDNYKIVKETKEGSNIFVDEVVGEANLKTVLPLFVQNIEEN